MANKNMNFGVDLLPTQSNTFDLGNSELKWNNIYGNLKGNADTVNGHSVNKDVPSNANFENTITTITSTEGTGNAITDISVDNNGALTINKELSFSTIDHKHVKADITDFPTLGTASAKNVDTSISAASTSTNLPTSAAVATFVEGKGYKTTDNNTTYTLVQDSTDGHKLTFTPSSGTATVITIPDNNTIYTHPTTSGNKHIPSGGSSNQILRWSADGTAIWSDEVGTTYENATTTVDGLMSASDKSKLDNIASGANAYTHPAGSAASKSSGFYKFSTDTTSHISAVTAVTKADITGLGIPAQDTTYSAGTGLSLSGITFNHSNSITAKTSYGSTATTASVNGGSIVVTDIKYDAQGHITGSTDRTITLSQTTYTLPTASTSTLGGIKVGTNLSIDSNGILSAVDTITTAETTGSGNAVTEITASNGKLTVTKGTTFLTSHQDISGKQDKTTAVTHTASDPAGSATVPIYVAADGVATPITSYSGNAASADKVNNALSFTVGGSSKGSYDGSIARTIDINAADLNISSALTFIGRTATIPTGHQEQITLTTGTTVTAKIGNVVIYTGNNEEFLYDDDKQWVSLGQASSFSFNIHTHGNIDNGGYLTNSDGTPQSSVILTTDSSGYITAGPTIGSGTTTYLRNDGEWATPTDTDTKVNVTLETTTKAYLLGVSTAPTSSASAMTAIADTGVYLDTTAGQLIATTFKGNLTGNVTGNVTGNISGSSGSCTGNAATATALSSSAGSSSQPVYFSSGKPVAVTQKDTANAQLNSLDTGSSTPVDADYYISQYVGGGTTTTTYHRRPMSALWNYIKGKADTLYSLIGHTHTKSDITDFPTLATVATSGSYNDLSNKPSIPSGAAANKGVDTEISAGSTSANLPTSAAVATFVEGKGYKTTDNNTTYTLTQDANDGHKITLTPSSGSATTITIPDNNTTYSSKTAASGGTDVSLVTTGEKYTWNSKTSNTGTVTSVTVTGSNGLSGSGTVTTSGTITLSNSGVRSITQNSSDGHKLTINTGGTETTITIPDNNTTYSDATTSTHGLMSTSDKTKLDNIYWIIGTGSTAGTWLGTESNITSYFDGLTIFYKTPIAGASTTTLNINSLGAKTCYLNNGSKLTTHYTTNSWIRLVYNSSLNSGSFIASDYDSNSNTVPAAYCSTAAATAAKVATQSGYIAKSDSYDLLTITTANSVQGAITLNINSQGAKPIYINGVASSSSNYTLPAGTYLCYYNGTNYYINTDGTIPKLTTASLTNATTKVLSIVDGSTTTNYNILVVT